MTSTAARQNILKIEFPGDISTLKVTFKFGALNEKLGLVKSRFPAVNL